MKSILVILRRRVLSVFNGMCHSGTLAVGVGMAVVGLFSTGCSDSDDGPDDGSGDSDESVCERTILVYMAACNSLGSSGFDQDDLAEMRNAAANGAFGEGRLLVFHADSQGDCRLFEITAGGDVGVKEYFPLADGLTSVHSERMLQVVADARNYAPSRQFGMIMWSHGTGWLQDGIGDTVPAKGVMKSWGEDRSRRMNITTLAETLDQIRPDFVYFDCCYMASVEVAYQLREATPYIVASCTELPAEGMPYHITLGYLFADGSADLSGSAKATYEYFNSNPEASQRTCTISVIRTAGLDALADAARAIYSAAPDEVPDGYAPQPFMTSSLCWYYDLNDYMHAMARTAPTSDSLIKAWDNALAGTIVYAAATQRLWDSVDIEHHGGLSTYIVTQSAMQNVKGYMTLSWPRYVRKITD